MMDIETVVLGGGPAGAATAAGLARMGREVMLLEKSSAPHHKVCGEFLSAETQQYLTALEIPTQELGAVPIEKIVLSSGKSLASAKLPFEGLSLSRHVLDEALLRRAEANGAMLKRGTPARSIVRNERGWTVYAREPGVSVQCRNLVIATGKTHLRGCEDDRDRSYVGMKIHLRAGSDTLASIGRQTLLLFFEQGYAGVQAVGGNTVNLCWMTPPSLLKRIGRNWNAWRAHLTHSAPLLANIAEGEPLWELPLTVVCPRGAYLRQDSEVQAFCVGDRMAHIPPFTGHGIGIALATAALAARYIVENASAGEFARAAQRLLLSPIRKASILAKISQNRIGRQLAAKAADWVPQLLSAAVTKTRISVQIT
jgi:menaquinone-9 beta-reductase